MAKIPGRTMLVEIETSDGSGTYINLCGIQSKTFAVNNEAVDVTTPDCTTPGGPLSSDFMEGIQSITIAGDGLVEDSVAETRLRNVVFSGTPTCNMRVTIPGVATWTGNWFLNGTEYVGPMVGGVGYSFNVQSKGTITKVEI